MARGLRQKTRARSRPSLARYFYRIFTEAQWRGRSLDFSTTLIILDLDDRGRGEGQMTVGAQLWFDDEDNLVINNFGSEPVRLINARRR